MSWELAVQFMPGRALSAGIKDVPELGGLTVQWVLADILGDRAIGHTLREDTGH